MGGFVPVVVTGSSMKGVMRSVLAGMQQRQYAGRSGGYSAEIDVVRGGIVRRVPLSALLDESLREALHRDTTRFYILEGAVGTGVEIVASLRFDDTPAGIHMASVMTALDGSGVGELHAQASFEKEKENVPKISDLAARRMYAECDRVSGITQKYHEWGFVTTKLASAGELLTFDIEWRNERGERLATTAEKMSQEVVMKNAQDAASVDQANAEIVYRMHKK
jgi:hypothetical protein